MLSLAHPFLLYILAWSTCKIWLPLNMSDLLHWLSGSAVFATVGTSFSRLTLEILCHSRLFDSFLISRRFARPTLSETKFDLTKEILRLTASVVARWALAILFPRRVLRRQADSLMTSRLHQVLCTTCRCRNANRALLPLLVIVLADWTLGHDYMGGVDLAADYASSLLLHMPSILSVSLLPLKLVGWSLHNYVDCLGVVGLVGMGWLDLTHTKRADLLATLRWINQYHLLLLPHVIIDFGYIFIASIVRGALRS